MSFQHSSQYTFFLNECCALVPLPNTKLISANAQTYLQDNGSLVKTVFELSCPSSQAVGDLLPAFVAELPEQNLQPSESSASENDNLHFSPLPLKFRQFFLKLARASSSYPCTAAQDLLDAVGHAVNATLLAKCPEHCLCLQDSGLLLHKAHMQ